MEAHQIQSVHHSFLTPVTVAKLLEKMSNYNRKTYYTIKLRNNEKFWDMQKNLGQ